MSRIGLQVTEESADLVAKIAQLPGIEIEGILHILPRQMSMIKLQPKSRLHFSEDDCNVRGTEC